jgi:hypothetical protein
MRSALSAASAALVLAALVASCGGKDICLGCDGNSTPSPQNQVTVTGNVNQIVDSSALLQQVRVVFCVDFTGDFLECDNTFTASVDSAGNFSRSRLPRGSLRVGFRLDPDDDGTFEPDEPWAELEDPRGQLTNLSGGQTVQLFDITIDFGANTATAAEIRVVNTPSPTPNPSAT